MLDRASTIILPKREGKDEKEMYMHSSIDETLYERIIAVLEQKGEMNQYDIESEVGKVGSSIVFLHLRTLWESGKVIRRNTKERYERGSTVYSIANDTDNPFDNPSLCDKILAFIKRKRQISEDYLKNSIAEFRQDEDISGLRRYLAPLIASKKIAREWIWLYYLQD
jgi:hypothetical protein